MTARILKHIPWPHLFLAALVGLILFIPVPTQATTPQAHEFTIDASRFVYAPAELQVNPGDRVTIRLKSLDVIHGLTIDGYPFELTAEPGQPDQITFTAGAPGVYRIRCSVTCGDMHPFMVGKLQIGRNDLFWRLAGALGVLMLGLAAWKRA